MRIGIRRRVWALSALVVAGMVACAVVAIVHIHGQATTVERQARSLSALLPVVSAETAIVSVAIADGRYSPAADSGGRVLDRQLDQRLDQLDPSARAAFLGDEARYDQEVDTLLGRVRSGTSRAGDLTRILRVAGGLRGKLAAASDSAVESAQRSRQRADTASFAIAMLALLGVGVYALLLRRAQRRLADLHAESLRAAGLRQAQRMESVGRLSAGIAHDFNNLLTGIVGYVGLVSARMGADDPNREPLQIALDTAMRASGLTKQLLAYGRQQELDPATIGANQLIDGIKGLIGGVVRPDITVTYVQHDDPLLFIEQSAIEQVVLNLVINAQDATVGTGRIDIGTCLRELPAGFSSHGQHVDAGSYAAITVADSGHGMDASTSAKVFDPYFTTKDSGHGLGLASAAGVVAQSGGMLSFKSEVGVGTTFDLLLPAIAA